MVVPLQKSGGVVGQDNPGVSTFVGHELRRPKEAGTHSSVNVDRHAQATVDFQVIDVGFDSFADRAV